MEKSMNKFKVAACQMLVSNDKNKNIAKARNMIARAASEFGAQLVVLPEMWNCPYSSSSFEAFAEALDGEDSSPSLKMLSQAAREAGITIVAGSIPEKSNGRLYNTCCVVGSDGELKGKHRKVHLFDVDMPGRITFKESETLSAGESLTLVDTDVGRVGVGICHDIRFPEVAMLYAQRVSGADLICYPGAFHVSTGNLWELEQRARAVDNQLYVVTCSPAREEDSDYLIWGHSTIVDPFGNVLASCKHEETIIVADVDQSRINEVRQNIPLKEQKRLDLYNLKEINQEN